MRVTTGLPKIAVYAETQDERRAYHDSIEKLTAHWATLQSNVTSWINRVLRDGLCHEACSRRHPYDSVSCLIRSAHGVSALPLTACAFRTCKPIAYPLSNLCAKYKSFSTGDYQSCFSSIYAGASGLAILTTRQLGVTFLTLALVARIFQSGQRNSRFKRCLEQSWLNFAYFSDFVCQVNISFTFDIDLWHMIGVRAPASPHGLARIRRKTTLCARWLTPPISVVVTILASPRPSRWSQIACT